MEQVGLVLKYVYLIIIHSRFESEVDISIGHRYRLLVSNIYCLAIYRYLVIS